MSRVRVHSREALVGCGRLFKWPHFTRRRRRRRRLSSPRLLIVAALWRPAWHGPSLARLLILVGGQDQVIVNKRFLFGRSARILTADDIQPTPRRVNTGRRAAREAYKHEPVLRGWTAFEVLRTCVLSGELVLHNLARCGPAPWHAGRVATK